MCARIDDLFIFDQHNKLILEHSFTFRPPPADALLKLYLSHPAPRPAVQYLPTFSPPTLLFSITQDGLLFLAPTASEIEPLLVLEFLHRVADALEEFLGSPLLAARVESNYDVVAQLLAEMCDAGMVAQTEANALRDVVETPSMMDKLFAGIGLPGSAPGLNGSPVSLALTLQRSAHDHAAGANNASQIPWRRSNVRHTSNELYVDMVETLQVTLAPSGRPLAAFANGSIAFTCKVSGVPDLLLSFNPGPGGGVFDQGERVRRKMEWPVFHPCIRLARWKEDGILSFVPPDGRFVLAGYQVDLLASASEPLSAKTSNLDLPVTLDIRKSLGSAGNEFEVKLTFNNRHVALSGGGLERGMAQSLKSQATRPTSTMRQPAGDSKAPKIEDLIVSIALPPSVRNVTDLRASRGEALWSAGDETVEWHVSGKTISGMNSAGPLTLRCTVAGGPWLDEDDASSAARRPLDGHAEYDEPGADAPGSLLSTSSYRAPSVLSTGADGARDPLRVAQSAAYMPTSAKLSFSIKGWLASGLRVDSLNIDMRKSKGLGEGIKPYKGVKYVTASDGGVEMRC